MNILVVTQYFWPETFIINDLVKELRDQGHMIVVATGKPNYPEGRVFSGYSAKGTQTEIYDGNINVIRVPLRVRGKGNVRELFLNYWSFIWSGLRFFPSMLKEYDFDIILVFALSPITSAIPAIPLKWRKKARLSIWVQDLWPESLSATGYVSNKLLLRFVGLMVKIIYYFSDLLLVQSRAFVGPVSEYSSPDKVVYFPNVSKDSFKRISSDTRIPNELLTILDSDFCLVFAGNLGSAQSLETILYAAERMKSYLDIKFIFVGSGSRSQWLEQQIKNLNLTNVIMAGRYPAEDMPQFFSRAKALLVTLKRKSIFSYTIPSKVQSYLSSGRPIIAALDGEGARVIKEANAGLSTPAEDVDGFVSSIRELYNMPEKKRLELGASGRQYYLANFEINRQCEQLVKILNELKR